MPIPPFSFSSLERPDTSASPPRSWILKVHHSLRTLAFANCFIICAFFLGTQARSLWLWLLLIVVFLIYPQGLYWYTKNKESIYLQEIRNLLIDAGLLGLCSAALGIPLWITFMLFIACVINNTLYLGLFGAMRSMVAFVGVAFLGLWLLPKHGTKYAESNLVIALCIIGICWYFLGIALAAHSRIKKLRTTREQLRESERNIQQKLREMQLLEQQLREQAIRDPLTNLYNRRYLENTLIREWAQCDRKQLPLSVLMIDIDHFKQVNDVYGHPAGDMVLQKLGLLLGTTIRISDIACRLGGEEFLLLLPGIAPQHAVERAELLRIQFADTPFFFASSSFFCTISIGVACIPSNVSQIDTLIPAADLALYHAKNNGRNQVVSYENLISQTFMVNARQDTAQGAVSL